MIKLIFTGKSSTVTQEAFEAEAASILQTEIKKRKRFYWSKTQINSAANAVLECWKDRFYWSTNGGIKDIPDRHIQSTIGFGSKISVKRMLIQDVRTHLKITQGEKQYGAIWLYIAWIIAKIIIDIFIERWTTDLPPT